MGHPVNTYMLYYARETDLHWWWVVAILYCQNLQRLVTCVNVKDAFRDQQCHHLHLDHMPALMCLYIQILCNFHKQEYTQCHTSCMCISCCCSQSDSCTWWFTVAPQQQEVGLSRKRSREKQSSLLFCHRYFLGKEPIPHSIHCWI